MKKAFTLIELLIVISIIGILTGLVLGVSSNVQKRARSARAAAEIQAIGLALDRYKTDTGDYPTITSSSGVNLASSGMYISDTTKYVGAAPVITAATSSTPGAITGGSGGMLLSAYLTGRLSLDAVSTNPPNNGFTQYIELKASQVRVAGCLTDPWGNPYGYYCDSTTTTSGNVTNRSLYNAVEPDIWSTAGEVNTAISSSTSAVYLRWVKNWPSQ